MTAQPAELIIARSAIEITERRVTGIDQVIDADPVGWITTNFYIPELHGPIELHPSQAEPLYEALRRGDNGLFVYSTVVWSAVKKSAKSSIAAAVGLWFAWRKPYSRIKVIANDLKQAESRVYYYMRRAIELHPVWRDLVKINRYEMTFPNGSKIEAIPIDPTGEAGGNDDLVIYSEIWGWKYAKAMQMWTESTLSPLLYGKSLRWGETYAGFEGESPVLEQLYDQGVKQGRAIGDEMYANAAARLFVLWRTQHLLPWQTPEYYAQEAATLTDNEYGRVHENRWGRTTSAFLPIEWWDSCRVEAMTDLERRQTCVIAADAAVSNDSFGLVMVSRKNGKPQVRYVREWIPPEGGEIDFSEPEAEIIRLCKEYPVVEVAYDEYQIANMMQRLKREHGIHCRKFSQGANREVADKKLHDLIRDREIEHRGEINLRDHINNANKSEEGKRDRLRLIKRNDKAKIDLAVCLSMAADRAKHLNLE